MHSGLFVLIRKKLKTSSWDIYFIASFTLVSTSSKMCFHDTDKMDLSGNIVQSKSYQNPNKSNLFIFTSTIEMLEKNFSKQNRINSSSYRAVPSLFITAL